MIVKNEEEVLERCLNSLKGLMDEIIIVDTGSTDSTKAVSYTHLSRKRQRPLTRGCARWSSAHRDRIIPVSYTHLDVYKRQALDKPTAGEVLLNGKNLVSLKEKEISAFRRCLLYTSRCV